MREEAKKEKIYYTPKQVSYNIGIPYSRILEAIKTNELQASRKNKNSSYIIKKEDLSDFLASLDEDFKNELIVSFRGKVPQTKIKAVTEDLIETFNKVKDKYSINLSLNIESR